MGSILYFQKKIKAGQRLGQKKSKERQKQKKDFTCEVCSKKFSTKRRRKTHQRLHFGSTNSCLKEQGSRGNLRTPQLSHTGTENGPELAENSQSSVSGVNQVQGNF